jgi:hypothetical protein
MMSLRFCREKGTIVVIRGVRRHLRESLLGGLLSVVLGVALALLSVLGVSAFAPAVARAEGCQKPSLSSSPVFGGLNPADPAKRSLTSVTLGGSVFDSGCETEWTIGWALTKGGEASGPRWRAFPGGKGTVPGSPSRTEFETGELTGLEPETVYYELGTLKNFVTREGNINVETEGKFETKSLRPDSVDIEASPIGESAARLRGLVEPAPFETRWRVEYSSSSEGPWQVATQGTITQAEAEALQNADGANSLNPEPELTGLAPNTRYYVRLFAEDEPEWPPSSGTRRHKEVTSNVIAFETLGSPAVEAFATPVLRLESLRALGYVTPHGFDTHYYFEYGPTVAYGSKTVEGDAGSGGSGGGGTSIVAGDLVGAQPGDTYHYRLVAKSAAAGGTTVVGRDHAVVVPVPAPASAPVACPNQAFRTGASAGLPDCRAYEQVTPVDKEGAEPFNQAGEGGVLVGEDGNHVVLSQPLASWGSGQSPYFFSREEGKGWQTTAGQAQPEAGIDRYGEWPSLFSPDLTSFAFTADWKTGTGVESPDIELRTGPPGGPYRTVASVPRAQFGEVAETGWVAASADFSKLILRVEDRALVPGHPSSTKSGFDLYEYTGGAFRQVNVAESGEAIGACGAAMPRPWSGAEGPTTAKTSPRDAVSRDGSRVFFSAVPGTNCSEKPNLYMRVNGTETVDIGPYAFLAANGEGTEVLVESQSADKQEVLLYRPGSGTTATSLSPLLTLHEHLVGREGVTLTVSEDFSTIYLDATEQLTSEAPPITNPHYIDIYRYDIGAKALRFVVQAQSPGEFTVNSDGRYAYWRGIVPGLPFGDHFQDDAILYDSVQNVVECVSCASAWNPEPKFSVAALNFGGSQVLESRDGTPRLTALSSDGSRAFFDTPAALLPSDIDEEIAASPAWWSPSSDVYEWRRNDVEGCTHVQGCLALVSSGRGGGNVLLLGADASGRDVFFTTNESLVAQDDDTAFDIYDARSGGGLPPPASRPVECKGDLCVTPFAAPSDPTPSSATFQGAGNLGSEIGPLDPVHAKLKPKKHAEKKSKKKHKDKKKQRPKRAKTRNGRRG